MYQVVLAGDAEALDEQRPVEPLNKPFHARRADLGAAAVLDVLESEHRL